MDLRRLSSCLAIASSAALLFVIQPMIAKALLPRFGGAAGVWIASMMFFQVVLLAGYLYSFWITRYPGPKLRTAVHVALLVLSLTALPLRSRAEWVSGNPMLSILLILAATVGLPFFVLSTTNPLVQSWYAGASGPALPYWMFAVSNAACLLALLSYPVVVEPALATTSQLHWWSMGYLVVVLLLILNTLQNRDRTFQAEPADLAAEPGRPWLWIALAACPSILWLAVANHLSQEVAPIPLLWVLPLTLYLLSFVLVFGWEQWYRPRLFRWLLPAAWIAISWRTGIADTRGNLALDISATLAALFILCLFCHGELAYSKPAARRELAFFYLMTATGGAAGGIFVALIAPNIFSSYLELPVGVVATVFLALVLIYGINGRARLIRLAVVAVAAFAIASHYRGGAAAVAGERNFYGTLEIRDRGAGDQAYRTLYNGRTVHGIEFLAPARRRIPTAYYGTESGVGQVFRALDMPERRAAMVGLGAGTLAAYGRKGDFFRFYEINPAVIEAASADFYFLADSAAAVDVAYGDGRLRLEQEPARSFDVIVLDAFSDDAIPVHLLTREAFAIYFARLRPGGPLAIHVSNRYLDLNPVVESLAQAFQKTVLYIHSPADPDVRTEAADWVIVADPGATIDKLRPYADPTPIKRGPLWTDESSNLLEVWK